MSKINLERQQPELAAKDLGALIDLYLADYKPRISKDAHKNYTLAIGYLRRWWLEVGPAQNWILRKNDFIEFVHWLEKLPNRQGGALASSTIDILCKRIKQLFQWAYEADYLDRDYGHWLPAINVQVIPRNLPALAELNRLFRVAGESTYAHRNKAILAVLIGTGMRRKECTDLDIANIEWDTTGTGGRLTVESGKGGKRRVCIFDAKTGVHIKFYLQITRYKFGPLFRGRTGRLTPKGLYRVVKEMAERAGLADKIQGPHDLRRLFATEWLRRNKGEGAVQPLSIQLGHTDPQMTLYYSKQNIEDVRKNFTSPMNHVDE